MKRFQFIIFIVVGLIIAATGLCLAQESFKLGFPVPLSGKNKKFGETMKNGAVMAIEDFNAKGGFTKGILKGKKLEIVFEDDADDPAKLKEIVKKFITEDKYPILVGTYSSTCALAMAEVAAEYGVPYLCQSGSADKITQQGWKNVFRPAHSSSQYPTGLNDFLAKVVKPKTMAIIYESTDYGQSLSLVMRKFCEKEGIKIVYDKSYVAKATDFSPMLLEVKNQNPDVIFMVSYLMDAILLMKQAKELDINPKMFVGGGAGFALDEFPKGAGDAAEYVVTLNLWSPDVKYPGAGAFAEKFRERYKSEPTYHSARGHIAIEIIIDALERAASLSKDDLIKALKETDIMTLHGPVKFEDFENFTNQNRLPALVSQVQLGKLVTVWPKDVAKIMYNYPVPKWSERK